MHIRIATVLVFAHVASALRIIEPSALASSLSRRGLVAAALGGSMVALPAFAERNVITKEEAAAAKATMVTRDTVATECDAKCEAEIAQRKARRALINEKKATFEAKVVSVEKATTKDTWIGASEELIQYLQEEAKKPDPVSHPPGKSVPEGVKIKEVVKRLRASYNALPTTRVSCGADVRADVKCFSPGESVEREYNTLIAEMRRNAGCATQDCKGSATEAF